MRTGLQGTMRIKGLLEMMFEVLSDWIDAFIEDIEEVEAAETGGSTTPKGSISPRDSRGDSGCSSQDKSFSLIDTYMSMVSGGKRSCRPIKYCKFCLIVPARQRLLLSTLPVCLYLPSPQSPSFGFAST